jgi:hypothetical protein
MVKFENVREDKKNKKNKKNYDSHQKYSSNSSENSSCSQRSQSSFDRDRSFRNSSVVDDKYSRDIQPTDTGDDSIENFDSRSHSSATTKESREDNVPIQSTQASKDEEA